MSPFEWTLAYMRHVEGRLSTLSPFEAPCPTLIRHVHRRKVTEYGAENRLRSWSDPVKRAARIAKRQATLDAKGGHEWSKWHPKEADE